MNLRYFIFCTLFSLSSICGAGEPKQLPRVIDYQKVFVLENATMSLNVYLCTQASELNNVWANLTEYASKKELKQKLDVIFNAMHNHCKQECPSLGNKLSFQDKKLYILEAETRLYMYSIYRLLSNGANMDYLLNAHN